MDDYKSKKYAVFELIFESNDLKYQQLIII